MYLCYIRKDDSTVYDDAIYLFWTCAEAKAFCNDNIGYVWHYYGIGLDVDRSHI